MTKVSAPAILSRESMPDAPDGDWFAALLEYNNACNDQTARTLRKGTTVNDNTPYVMQSYKLKHGVETEIANPLEGLTIKGVFAMQCEGVTMDATGLATGAIYSLGLASPLSWRPSGKSSGSVFVTARYDLKHQDPHIELTNNANQALTTATWTPLSFQTTEVSDSSGIITISSNGVAPLNTRINVSETGIYLCDFSTPWASNSTGFRATLAQKNGAGSFTGSGIAYGQEERPAVTGDTTVAAASFSVVLSAGDYVEIFAYQSSGGNLNVPTGNSGLRCQMTRLRNNMVPTGRVKLFFYGE